MNHKIWSLREPKIEKEAQCATRCEVSDVTGGLCGETSTFDILKLFNQLYLDRLRNVRGDNEAVQETLLWWVEDLNEQNRLLVETVETLEREFVGTANSMAGCMKKQAKDESREALTLEVAEKHDQLMALKREVQHLEERLLQADKQTHFKDDIIREMRKQLKMASSKVSSGGPDLVSVKPKRLTFSGDCDLASSGNCIEDGSSNGKIDSNTELVNSLQKKLRCTERELNQCRKAVVSGASLKDLEEFRLRTVEAVSVVEDMKDELFVLVNNMLLYESQMEVVSKAVEKCSCALGEARSKLGDWRAPDSESTAGDVANLCEVVDSAKEALQQVADCAHGFLEGGPRRRHIRIIGERRMEHLVEMLQNAHRSMRSSVKTLSKAVEDKSRQQADNIEDNSSKAVCDGHDCVLNDEVNRLRDELERLRLNSAAGVADSSFSGSNHVVDPEWLRTKEPMVKEMMSANKKDSLQEAEEEIGAPKEGPSKKELTLDLLETHHQFQLCYDEAARQDQWLTSLRSAVHELRERADLEKLHTAAAQREAERLRQVALLQTARGNLLEEQLRMVEDTAMCVQFEGCTCNRSHACWRI